MLQVKGGGAVGVGGGRVRRQERHQRTPGDTATPPAYSSRPVEGGREGREQPSSAACSVEQDVSRSDMSSVRYE